MPRSTLAALLLAALSIVSCDSRPTQPSSAAEEPTLGTATAEAAARYAPRFNPDNFVRAVDNRYSH